MPLLVDPWERILQEPGFQALSHEDKSRVASNFFDGHIAKEKGFQALRPDQQERVKSNFLSSLGPQPEDPNDEIGAIENFFKSAYNSGVQTVSDYYSLVGEFEEAQRFAQEHQYETVGGASEFAGGVVGSIVPSAVALLGGPYTAWAVVAHYGLQSSGSARKRIHEYRQAHPEEAADPFNEFVQTVGSGAVGAGLGWTKINKILAPALKNVTPGVLRKIGFDFLGGKLGQGARSMAQLMLGEGAEEGTQELLANALHKYFTDSEQALTEGVGMAALGGALGGGLLTTLKLAPKYRRGLREDRMIFERAREETDKLAHGEVTNKVIDSFEARWRATGDPSVLEDLQRHMRQVKFYNVMFGENPENMPDLQADQEVLLLPQITATAEEQIREQIQPQPIPLLAEAKSTTYLLPAPTVEIGGEQEVEEVRGPDGQPRTVVRAEASGPTVELPTSRIILSEGGPAAQWESNESIELALDAANAAAARLEAQFAQGREPKKTMAAYDEAMAELHTQWTMVNPGDVTGDGLLFYLNQRSRGRNIRPRRYSSAEERARRAETRQEIRTLREEVQALEKTVLRPNQRRKRRGGAIGKETLGAMTPTELARYEKYLQGLEQRRERDRRQRERQATVTEQTGETRPRPRRVAPGVSGADIAAAEAEGITPTEARDRRLNLNRDIIEANKAEHEAGGLPFTVEQSYGQNPAELQAIADALGKDISELKMSDLDTRRTFIPEDLNETPEGYDQNEEDAFQYSTRYGGLESFGYSVDGVSFMSPAEIQSREPSILQRHRLTNILVKNGFFSTVHWTGGQITGPDGRKKNAVVNTRTGEVWFSRDANFSHIGHEATHRLIELMGKNHPLVQQGLEIAKMVDVSRTQKEQAARAATAAQAVPAGLTPDQQQQAIQDHLAEETLSDMVGDYFAARQIKASESTWARFVNWIHDLWHAARVKYASWRGRDVLAEDVIHALNARLAKHIDQNLALEPRAAAKHLSDIYHKGSSEINESRQPGTFKYSDADEPVSPFRVNIKHNEILHELDFAVEGVDAAELEAEALTSAQLHARALDILTKPKTLQRIQREFGRGGGRISIHGMLALRIKANLRFKKIFEEIARVEGMVEMTGKNADVQLEALDTELHKELRLLGDLSRFAGRALQSMNVNAGPTAVIKAVQNLNRRLTTAELQELSVLLDTGGINNEALVQDFNKRLKDPRASDYFWEYVMNGWLSGVPTHLVNVGNNAMWLAHQVPDRYVQATIDRALTKAGSSNNLVAKALQWVFPTIRGKERQVFFEEVAPFLAGLKRGRQEVKETHLVRETLKGRTMPDIASKFAIDMGSARRAFARSPHAALRKVAPIVSFPGNALFAMDVYFRTLAFDAQMNSLAYRESRKTGKPMRDILAHPPKKLVQQARDFAAMATFNDRPGRTARFVMHWRDKLPFQAGRLVVPFVNTLTNIFKRGIEMTPGLGAVANRQRLREADVELLARQFEGTVLATILMLMFDSDDITTNVPESPTKRAAFYQQGKIPYAIRMPSWMGGTWVSYNRVEPLNTVISSIATAWQAFTNPEVEEDENVMVQTMLQLANGVYENLIASTYAENVERLFKPNIGEGAKRTLERIPASLVPASSFFRSLSRAWEAKFAFAGGPEEAKVRERTGWVSELAQTLPWDSAVFEEQDRGFPRVDAFGEEITIPGNALRQWLPLKWSTPDLDPVEEELARLDAMPGLPSQKFEIDGQSVTMPPEMYHRYAMAYGAQTKESLSRLIQAPGFQRLSDEQKLLRIDRLVRRVHRVMRARGLRELRVSRR